MSIILSYFLTIKRIKQIALIIPILFIKILNVNFYIRQHKKILKCLNN